MLHYLDKDLSLWVNLNAFNSNVNLSNLVFNFYFCIQDRNSILT